MGRELRRKEAKKNGMDVNNDYVNESFDWRAACLISGIVIIILVVLYFVVASVNGDFKKDNTSNKNNSEIAATVANPILANAIFKQSEEEYYVYVYDFNDSDSNVGNTISNNLINNKVYRVNTGDSMNKNYIGESALELQLTNSTLLKIVNDQVVLRLNGKDEIIKYYAK